MSSERKQRNSVMNPSDKTKVLPGKKDLTVWGYCSLFTAHWHSSGGTLQVSHKFLLKGRQVFIKGSAEVFQTVIRLSE